MVLSRLRFLTKTLGTLHRHTCRLLTTSVHLVLCFLIFVLRRNITEQQFKAEHPLLFSHVTESIEESDGERKIRNNTTTSKIKAQYPSFGRDFASQFLISLIKSSQIQTK
jgi:hypothetical protein